MQARTVPSGGSIACNPGQKDAVKLPPQRAVFESISNSLNAVAVDKTGAVCVAEFFPKCPHPMALTDDHLNICCKTVSNSYLDPQNYGSAINMGRTRGTEQGTDKQTVGNDIGIGMKESVNSLGGSLGFISVDMTNADHIKVAGFIVDDQVMELRAFKGVTQQKELSYCTFEAVYNRTGKKKTRMVYPVNPAVPSEYSDMLALFCTGLPFCKDDTHFKDTGIDDVLSPINDNKANFIKFIENHVTDCLEWQSSMFDRLMQDKELSFHANHDPSATLSASLKQRSTWYCHSMASEIFKEATDGNPDDLAEDYKKLVPCHKWCVTGDSFPLSFSIAREINYPYYDIRNNTVIVMLEGIDIRKANVYIPLLRMNKHIMARKAAISNSITDATLRGKGHDLAKVSFCNAWSGDESVEAVLSDSSFATGVPIIEWGNDSDDGPVQTWPSWDIADTRGPPLGTIVVRGPTVINKDDPALFWFNMNNYVEGGVMPNRLRQQYTNAVYKTGGDCAKDQGLRNLQRYCWLLDIRGRPEKSNKWFMTSVLEKSVGEKLDSLYPESADFQYPRVTAPFLDCMLMTKSANDLKRFFPDDFDMDTSKNYLQRVFGVTACSILELNPDLFTVNVEKTKVGPVSKEDVSINMMCSGYFASSSLFCTNFALPRAYTDKIDFIKANQQLFSNAFPPSHVAEARQATQQVRDKDHVNTPLAEWVHMVKDFQRSEENTAGILKFPYYKNANRREWMAEVHVRSSGSSSGTLDVYFIHAEHFRKFKDQRLRTIESVLWFDKWYSEGCPMENDSDRANARAHLKDWFLQLQESKRAEEASVQVDSGGVIMVDSGDDAMADPAWAQGRRGVGQSTTDPRTAAAAAEAAAEAIALRKRMKRPHRSELYAKKWYDTHNETDPLFAWKTGKLEFDDRIEHFIAMDAKLQDNTRFKDTTTPVFTWNEFADMARCLVNFTDTEVGRVSMQKINKKADVGVGKRQKTGASASTDAGSPMIITEVD